jgi:hypothetical protein
VLQSFDCGWISNRAEHPRIADQSAKMPLLSYVDVFGLVALGSLFDVELNRLPFL